MVAKTALLLLLGLSVMAISCRGDAAGNEPAATLTASTSTPTATPAPTAVPTPTPPDTSRYPPGTLGYAISWPQCGSPYPEEPFDFGIIGVNNGESFTDNPCFEDEYRWAERGRYHPGIYMNTSYSEAIAPNNEMTACGEDAMCRAYEYGRASAAAAYEYAASFDAVAPVWWLDVQIVSVWSEDKTLNAESIRGAGDFLQEKGVRIGLSSTAFQWATVAGQSRPGGTIWDASALDREMADTFCSEGKDFGGGSTELIAYVEQFETVVACPMSAP